MSTNPVFSMSKRTTLIGSLSSLCLTLTISSVEMFKTCSLVVSKTCQKQSAGWSTPCEGQFEDVPRGSFRLASFSTSSSDTISPSPKGRRGSSSRVQFGGRDLTWIVNEWEKKLWMWASIYTALLFCAYFDLILSCKHTSMLIIPVLADAFLPSSLFSCRLKGLELSVSSPSSTYSTLYQLSGSAALIIIWPHLFGWLGEFWFSFCMLCEHCKVGVSIHLAALTLLYFTKVVLWQQLV